MIFMGRRNYTDAQSSLTPFNAKWYPQVLNRVHSGLHNSVPEFTHDKAEAGMAKWPVQTFRWKQIGNAQDRLGSLTSHTDAASWQGQDSSAIDLPSSFPSSHDQQPLLTLSEKLTWMVLQTLTSANQFRKHPINDTEVSLATKES